MKERQKPTIPEAVLSRESIQPYKEMVVLRQMADSQEKNEPSIWSIVYPRIYQDIGEFGSPRIAAACCGDALAKLNYMTVQQAPSMRAHLLAALKMKRFIFPNYFLAKELWQASQQTQLPPDTDWLTIKFPMESAIMVLPKNVLIHPSGVPIDFLGYARVQKDEVFDYDSHRFQSEFTSLIMFTGIDTPNGAEILSHHQHHHLSPLVKESVPAATVQPYDLLANPMSSGENEWLNAQFYGLCSLLGLMSARPSLVEHGRKIGIHKKSGRQFWTPNIVGKGYRLKRHEPQDGTHASPRTHWRRGHLREQHFGAGLAESKIIWIEPMLISGDAEAAA